MKYAAEMDSDATIYIPSFMNSKFDGRIHRQHCDLISLISFFLRYLPSATLVYTGRIW
jgi:hypothetical protein